MADLNTNRDRRQALIRTGCVPPLRLVRKGFRSETHRLSVRAWLPAVPAYLAGMNPAEMDLLLSKKTPLELLDGRGPGSV